MQATALHRILYRSQATSTLAPRELQRLLEQARERNQRDQVTGVLIVHGDRFVQWLEGPADGLAQLWRGIQRDPRHGAIESLPVPDGGDPGLSVVLGADGDGLGQGSAAEDIEAMRRYAAMRPHSPAMMVAQATLNDVVPHVQQRRLGVPEMREASLQSARRDSARLR